MKDKLERYSIITGKIPREAVLLQGKGCVWKKCTFCDYYHDVSESPFEINKPAIESITGKFGAVDVSNSGSAMELDEITTDALIKKVASTGVRTLWFEARWNYRRKLREFSEKFPDVTVKFRTGIESFNPRLRSKWNKGIPDDLPPSAVAEYFNGVSLLAGMEGQSCDDIIRDVETADKHFEYFSVNVFTPNTTKHKRNDKLVEEFLHRVYPDLSKNPKAEILLKNVDWGIG